MRRGLGLSLVAAALLLVPSMASAADHLRQHRDHWRSDIRRNVHEAVREARRTRFAARRDVYRALAHDRWAARHAARSTMRDAHRAARELRRRLFD